MTYRIPSLNGLKAFEAAARHLSFKAAAGELNVTAGAISQQVKRLESSLGIALFRRLPQGLILTAEGASYLPRISMAFEVLTDATEAIAPALNGRKLTLGISQSVKLGLEGRWPRRSSKLDAYLREIRTCEDVELIWSNEVDALLLDRPTNHSNLSEQEVCPLGLGCLSRVFYVTRPGLANCRQSRAILDDLQT